MCVVRACACVCMCVCVCVKKLSFDNKQRLICYQNQPTKPTSTYICICSRMS